MKSDEGKIKIKPDYKRGKKFNTDLQLRTNWWVKKNLENTEIEGFLHPSSFIRTHFP